MFIKCPKCSSRQIDPLETVHQDGSLFDPMSNRYQVMRNILAYAGMGAGLGRKIKSVHPAIGCVAGAVAGLVVGGVVYGSSNQIVRDILSDVIFQHYHCNSCGHTFRRSKLQVS